MLQIFYYKDADRNFGDDINEFLWEELLPGAWSKQARTRFACIGTILSPWMPTDGPWIIFGSGTGYGAPSIDLNSPSVNVISVRGPLTAAVLRLPPSKAVTDGAILLSKLSRFAEVPLADRKGTIFIPHRSALGEGNWELACERAGVQFVSPREDCESVLHAIRGSKLVLADSMHAAIVADTFRVPWIPVRTGAEINAFKWMDWAGSMSVPYNPVDLPSSTPAEAWRSANIKWRVLRGRAAPTSPEEAIASYPGLNLVMKRQSRLYKSRIFRASLRAVRSAPALYRAHFMKDAVRKIAELSKQKGYLSTEETFLSKRDELFRRLKLVGAAEPMRNGTSH